MGILDVKIKQRSIIPEEEKTEEEEVNCEKWLVLDVILAFFNVVLYQNPLTSHFYK